MEETTTAERVGARIRKIRNLRHITQYELGERVGLNGDRIQKYENGARNPRSDVLENIAEALDCSIYALMDPVASTPLGAMFTFFQMEDDYALSLKREEDKYILEIPVQKNPELASYLAMWMVRIKQQEAESANIMLTKEERRDRWKRDMRELQESYDLWKACFPESVTEEMRKIVKKQEIEEQIEKLKMQMEELDS